jgi:hypothetical protein
MKDAIKRTKVLLRQIQELGPIQARRLHLHHINSKTPTNAQVIIRTLKSDPKYKKRGKHI